MLEEAEFNDTWARSPHVDAQQVQTAISSLSLESSRDLNSESGELPLWYGPQTEDFDSIAAPASDELDVNTSSVAQSLVGHWSGSYAYSDQDGDGLVGFTITSHREGGAIDGSGVDAFGPFTVHGTLDGSRITFLKEYQLLQYGSSEKTVWRYEGVVSADTDEITGEWGPPDSNWQYTPGDEDDAAETSDDPLGSEAK